MKNNDFKVKEMKQKDVLTKHNDLLNVTFRGTPVFEIMYMYCIGMNPGWVHSNHPN